MRQVLREVEDKRFSDPEDLIDAPDASRIIKSYSVTADLETATKLGSEDAGRMEEEARTVCSRTTRTQLVVYRTSKWLVLRRSVAADELHADVVSGRVKYAAISGAVVRIMVPDEHDMPMNVVLTLSQYKGNVRVFRVAAAFDAVAEEDPSCTTAGTLPISSDPVRLWRALSTPDVRLLGLMIWAWA